MYNLEITELGKTIIGDLPGYFRSFLILNIKYPKSSVLVKRPPERFQN